MEFKNKRLVRRLKPGICVFKEKHHTRLFICHTPEDYCKVAMKVLKQRLKDKWYWDEKDIIDAERIITDKDLEEAFIFIDCHSDGEYE